MDSSDNTDNRIECAVPISYNFSHKCRQQDVRSDKC